MTRTLLKCARAHTAFSENFPEWYLQCPALYCEEGRGRKGRTYATPLHGHTPGAILQAEHSARNYWIVSIKIRITSYRLTSTWIKQIIAGVVKYWQYIFCTNGSYRSRSYHDDDDHMQLWHTLSSDPTILRGCGLRRREFYVPSKVRSCVLPIRVTYKIVILTCKVKQSSEQECLSEYI